MRLIYLLLLKDFKRVFRNPAPVIILIAIPLLITALIGVAFGGMNNDNGSGISPIRLGIVDEDQSVFSEFLSGAMGQDDFQERIQAQFLDREEALKMVSQGELSAVLIIPERFTDEFLTGESPIQLTLIKNPAEYIYPTLAQEGADLIVTVLNTVARNFREDLHDLVEVIDNDGKFDLFMDSLKLMEVADRALERLEAAEDYLNPPLVSYDREEQPEEEPDTDEGSTSNNSIFSYLLVGMAAMFLLMIGDNCMRDLYKESRFKTLTRYQTLQPRLFSFVVSKVIYTVLVLMIVATILLGGGSLVFKFHWQHLDKLVLMVIAYSLFAAGLMGFFAALAGKERRADFLNTIFVIIVSMLGGSMWPPENLPPFIRNFVTPNTPPYWFSNTIRQLQYDSASSDWLMYFSLLIGLSIIFIGAAAWLFQFRLEKGIKE